MLLMLIFVLALIISFEKKLLIFSWKLLAKLFIGLIIVYFICVVLDEIRLLTYFWFI